MYSIRTKETRGLLAVIMAFVMMFAGVAFIAAEVDAEGDASESTGYVMFNETSYPSLNAAMTAAEDVVKTNPDATYTFEVYGNVEWITGAEHGSTPFVKEGTDSVNTIFNIIGDGKTSTITAIGDGVGPLGLVNGTVNYNNLTIIDESVSYAENNWEFTYLEFRGVSVFNNCYFKCAISVDHDNGNNQGKTISFNKCIFESQKDSEYGVWVGDGTVSFTECNFTSYRGLKIHECYGSQLHSVTVDNCKFVNLTEKPGIAIGDVYQSGEEGSYGEDKPVEWEDTSNTLIVVKNCTFIGCEAGDQSRYVYETDTELGSWFTFIDNEIIVMSGSTLGNITLTEGAIVTLEEGALFEGTVTSGTDKLTGKFKAGSGGVTFSVGSIVMDGNPIDIPSGASSITVSGEVELSGEIGVDIIVEASEEPGKETVVTIPENSNTTLKSGVTITLKSNTSMDILGTLDGDADSIVMDDGADNVDVNAKDPESVESIVSSEIDVGEPGVTTVKTAEEFIAALGDSRTETVVLLDSIAINMVLDVTNATIDLNGFKLSFLKGDSIFRGETNIYNGELNISGCISKADAIFNIGYGADSGLFNLEDVDVVGSDFSSAFGVFYLRNDSVFNMLGGSIILSNDVSSSGGVFKANQSEGAEGVINIKGTESDPVELKITNVTRGIVKGTVELDNVQFEMTGGDNGIHSSALTVKNSTVMIKNGNGRALTIGQEDVVLVNSIFEFSNMGEGEIRFDKDSNIIADSESTIKACDAYALDGVTGKINGMGVNGTSGNTNLVVVNNGVANVDNKGSKVFLISGSYSIGYDSVNEAIGVSKVGDIVKVVSDVVATGEITIKPGTTLIVENLVTLGMAGFNVMVSGADSATSTAAGELQVYGNIKGTGIIEVYGNVYLEAADVRMSVVVYDDDGQDGFVSISKPKKMTVTGNQTADLGVGYGNTLVLKDLDVPSGKKIQAWGTVILEGTVTVESNDGFHVYKGGNAQVDGTLIIKGTANIFGEVVINGSVKVTNDDGTASFNSDGEVTISEGATFDVVKAKSKGASSQNSLNGFIINKGTLNVTGAISGMVMDEGTFNMNGTSDRTIVLMTDGTSMTIGAVHGSMILAPMLSIEDIKDLVDRYSGQSNFLEVERFSDLPILLLADVGGVTATASYETVNYTDDEDDKKRAHLFGLDVTGSVKAVDESEVPANGITSVVFLTELLESSQNNNLSAVLSQLIEDDLPKNVGSSTGAISDLSLGKNVVFTMGTGVVVKGTVSAMADDTVVSTLGPVDMAGTIVIGDDCITNPDEDGDSTDLQVNGAKYTVTDNTKGETTTYYTTLENALATVSTADENEVYILGEIDVDTVIEIPAEATVTMNDDSEITIGVDGKITVAATAELVASDGEIDVEGMLVIIDKESGFEAPSSKDAFTYQVYTVDGDTETYSGLVLALQNATEGDVITLKQNADITKSVTIPAGVTLEVPKGTILKIGDDESKDDVTLTVAGTLKVLGSIEKQGAKKVEVSVPGVIVKSSDAVFAHSQDGTTGVILDDYVTFVMRIDGKDMTVFSNLAYAAENATEGEVTIVGDVSAGDITFTMGEKATEFDILFGAADSTMTVGTMTLVSNGKADIVLATANGTVTGTVASAAGSVDINKVSGITVAVGIETDVDGTTDYMTVFGTLDGKMTIATGTVTVNSEGDDAGDKKLTVGSSKDDILTVATGATLAVPEGAQIVIDAMAVEASVKQYYALVVDGTLSFEKGTIDYVAPATSDEKIAEVLVNGTMTVKDSAITMDGVLEVLGNLDVIDDEELSTSFTVDGVLIIGSAPALGANGTVTGPIAIKDNSSTSLVIAYAGADVSAAVIDPSADGTKSEAKYTEIVINGVPYMTVYVDKDANVLLTSIEEYIEAEGFDTKNVSWGDYEGASIGQYPTVEGTVEAKYIGLTVSAGVGLQVYIDGLAIENYKSDEVTGYTYAIQLGTHTVSFAVESGYDGSAATITVNGVAVSNNGTFTLDVDDKSATIIASGAVPAQSGSTVVVDEDDGMALTDILLIVLVVLIVIMAIIVALRMMRS